MKGKTERKYFLRNTISILLSLAIFITSTGFIGNRNEVEAVNLVQNASLGISSPLYEGGQVSFTITVKNTGSTTSPHFHPYVEGYSANGQLFRADNSNPSTYQLSPGSSKTFTTSHDLWYGHAGTWETYGIYLWNDDTNSFYGQLNANGYDQSKSFNVLGVNDIRQNGPISISGNLQEGGIVYLDIPIKNFGSATSMAMHVYTEGYTSQNKLWRADGAQPTAVQLAPGQTKTIRVRHDIWYGHAGMWTTYGVYIWNDYNNTYFAPLNANGYDQTLSFNTTTTPVQSLDIQYWDDANKAIDISYDVLSLNSDGSITVDLTVKNKRWIPLVWDVTNVGFITDRDNTIQNIANLSFMVITPRTEKTIEQVRFPRNSQLTFLYAKAGFNETQYDYVVIIDVLLFIYTEVFGEIPTGDNFKDFDAIISTIMEGAWEAVVGGIGATLGTVATKIALRDFKGAFETILLDADKWADAVLQIAGFVLQESILKTRIISAIYSIGLWLHFLPMLKFTNDLIFTPSNPVVKMVPSTRPINNSLLNNELNVNRPNSELLASQLTAEILDVTSEHSIDYEPELILDGIINTGWTSAMGEEGLESINLRLTNSTPAVLTSMKVNPGPILNDHQASAVKEFEIYTSLNGIDYSHLFTGSFAESELLTLKTFTFTARLAEYIKIVITENQSDNAVKYMDLGDILLFGNPISQNDIYEPDSKSEIAREIRSDGLQEKHNINYQQDNDWYYFIGKEGEKVKLKLSTLESDLDIKLEVYQPNGTLIFSYIQNPGQEKVFNATLTQTGKFTIRIYLPGNYGDIYKPSTKYGIGFKGERTNIYLPVIQR